MESDIEDDDDHPKRHTSPPQDMAGTGQKKVSRDTNMP